MNQENSRVTMAGGMGQTQVTYSYLFVFEILAIYCTLSNTVHMVNAQ